MPGDAGALATGVVTGDDSELSDESADAFNMTGTSHITAVSGQNVALIIGFCSFWFHPKRHGARVAYHVLLVAIVWVFTALVGMEPPALRAALVATLSILGSHTGRRPDPVTLLAMTIGAMALLQPLVVHTVGFWLSTVASMSLCLVLPKRMSARTTANWIRIAAGPCVASVATMPIALSTFGAWSPVGIIANILIAPLMALAFPLAYGFAVIAVLVPDLADYAALAPTMVLETVLVIVRTLAPVSAQVRVDTISPGALAALWIPIGIGVWLMSEECHRWLRRVITVWQQRPRVRPTQPA